jgi:membrane-bound acyltransferase YfiQ involved in biofilm formation
MNLILLYFSEIFFVGFFNRIFLFWIFYFVFGMIVGINIEYFRELVSNINTSLLFLLLISTLILQILEMFYRINIYNIPIVQSSHFLRPVVLIYSTFFICMISNILYRHLNMAKSPFLEIIGQVGSFSYGIYLSHPFFQAIFVALFQYLNIQYYNNISLLIIMFSFVLLVSYITTYICTESKVGLYVVGKVR